MKNVKRILAMSLMTVVGASVLVGCGNDSSTGGGSSKGKVEVSIFQYKVEQKDAFEKAAKEYEKSHDGVSIDIKTDRKSTRLNSSHRCTSRMPSSA